MTHIDTADMQPNEIDWHPADIVAALHKSGISLRKLSAAHGYNPGSLRHCLRHPYPKAQGIIADHLGLKPQVIWPSRYDSRGRSNRNMGRPTEKSTRSAKKSTSSDEIRNTQKGEAA